MPYIRLRLHSTAHRRSPFHACLVLLLRLQHLLLLPRLRLLRPLLLLLLWWWRQAPALCTPLLPLLVLAVRLQELGCLGDAPEHHSSVHLQLILSCKDRERAHRQAILWAMLLLLSCHKNMDLNTDAALA
jgi:hypothetical protein